MCAIDYAEPFADYTDQWITAHASVSCSECHRIIQLGERYQYIRGLIDVDEDYWEHFRTCRHCAAAGSWLDEMCGGWPLCTLIEELEVHRDEYPSSAVLEDLYRSAVSKWSEGAEAIPDAAMLRSDVERCCRELTVA